MIYGPLAELVLLGNLLYSLYVSELLISWLSPVNDILEKEQFTLEELLVEDELLQEVKSKNANLIKLYVISFSFFIIM